MADVGYINEAVRKMYGIPLSQLTPEQRKTLHEDSLRRAKLIEEREKEFMLNNRRAFKDTDQFNKILTALYGNAQKSILADVAGTVAEVKKGGGEWSYAQMSKLTRSRGLFEQINKELVKLGKEEDTHFRTHLQNIYTDQFLRNLYTLGQTTPLKGNGSFNLLNPRLIQDSLDYPWSGAMFSDRLWVDKERLGRNIRIGLTQSMILGEDMDKIADRIGANIDTSRYNAMRVARTETKRVTYVSQVDAFKEQGIKEVRYMAANNGGDSRTCDSCRGDHGKKFKIGEEPTLPRHPNCRCWYIPVTPDTFGDNELNELTGSVRGAENYEKWKEAQAAKIAEQTATGEKTPQQIITDRVEADMKRGRDERKSLTLQIDSLQTEHDGIPGQYSQKIAELEAKKTPFRGIMTKEEQEIDLLSAEKEGIPEKRRLFGKKWDAGEISEDEYDTQMDKLRARRREITALISESEDRIYAASREIDKVEDEIRKVRQEIQGKQADIKKKIQGLNEAIQLSLADELDLGLDITYVGDSKERLDTVDLFRDLRKGHRTIKTFDMDTYKDELVKMSQRMDKDALTVQKKISRHLQAHEYSEKDTGWYSPVYHKIHMDMSSNTHEKALGNGLKGAWQTKFHEEGHQLDHLLGKVTEISGLDTPIGRAFTSAVTPTGKRIQEAIERDLLAFVNTSIQYSNEKEGCSYKPLKSFTRISSDARFAFARYMGHLTSNGTDRKVSCQMGVLTDAIGLFTKDKISRNTLPFGGWGHKSYYNKERGKDGSASETWATFCAIRVCGSEEEIKMMKRVMPETWSTMDKIYHDVAVYLETHDLEY